MKWLNIVKYTVLLTVLLNTSFSFADFDEETKIQSIKNINQLFNKFKANCINGYFTFKTEKIVEESEFLKSNISYPFFHIKDEFECKKGDSFQIIDDINKKINDYVIDFNKTVKEKSQLYEKQYKNSSNKSKLEYQKFQYEAYSDYKVTYNKHNLISIPIKMYEFNGGVHGNTYLKTFNYDLLSGEEVKLKDLFKEDVNYKNIVDDFIKLQINKKEDIFFSGNNKFKGINDNQNFYIDNEGVVIYFQVYEIAPHYVGTPKFKMTWDEFGEYFK